MCIYTYLYVYVYVSIYIYMYRDACTRAVAEAGILERPKDESLQASLLYIYRERDIEREIEPLGQCTISISSYRYLGASTSCINSI